MKQIRLVICATCPAALTQADRSMRCRRCQTCRSAQPGKPIHPKPTEAAKRSFGQFTIAPPKKVAKTTTESWWLRPEFQGDRAAFQQHARGSPSGIDNREGDRVTPDPREIRQVDDQEELSRMDTKADAER